MVKPHQSEESIVRIDVIGVRIPSALQTNQNNKNMEKYYITSDKVGEFVAKMYAAGIQVDAEPQRDQLVVHLPNGGYEWIQVFSTSSFDELCATFLPKTSHIANMEE